LLRGSLPQYGEYMMISPVEATAHTGRLVFRLGLWIGIAMLGLALLDFLYQRWEFEQSIRMTRQEVKEELRQTEGDPHVRSRIRQRQLQIASARMMAKVPTTSAVALKYDP